MELKEYQQAVLTKFDHFLATLGDQKHMLDAAAETLRAAGMESIDLGDPAAKAWDALNQERRLPLLRDEERRDFIAPYLTRRDGVLVPIPNVCLKVPTGGGKTLLATACVERVQLDFFKRQTGFVLWIVPSDAIYRQTWKQLANREHPYRQMLERASGGRVDGVSRWGQSVDGVRVHGLTKLLLIIDSFTLPPFSGCFFGSPPE